MVLVKKAKELVNKHKITTIKELREKQDDVLNDVQKGLKYYEDIIKRIHVLKLICIM